MSVEELRKAVLEKAKAEADEIIREALRRAKEIVEEAEEKKKQIIESERRKIQAELKVEARIAEARRRARLIVTSARSDFVREVEKRAIEKLKSLDPETRKRSLEALILEALKAIKEVSPHAVELEVFVAPGDKALAAEILSNISGSKFVIHEDPSILGGVKISCCEGQVVVDNTYNARLGKALSVVVKEISEAERS